MIRIRHNTTQTPTSDTGLKKAEWWAVFILCAIDPLIAGGVFYYGWKKHLPKKAHQANQLSLWVFFIEFVLFFGFVTLWG
ncbi:hypothetical protein KC727_00175 [Candidatus Kaiserbacteria bacterium]|nr:hypothetical protein [Candidatus Kaiserbacteria bacterium]